MDFGNFGQYCTPAYQASCLQSSPDIADFINGFSTTGAVVNISNLNTGCNGTFPQNYTFHPSMNLTVAQGCNFSATMSCGNYGQGFAIWIDWNQDLDFNDAGEYCYNSGGAIPSYGSTTGTVNVPAALQPLLGMKKFELA